MNLPLAEVYEVATFYHHFEVLRDDVLGPVLTVRVCDGLSCELAGARQLLARLPAILGTEVRLIAAPCLGPASRRRWRWCTKTRCCRPRQNRWLW